MSEKPATSEGEQNTIQSGEVPGVGRETKDTSQDSGLNQAELLAQEKSKFNRSQKSWNIEKISASLSLVGALCYLVIGYNLYGNPDKEMLYNGVIALSGIAMIQHWLYLLFKIYKDPISSAKKAVSYFLVIVFPPLAAWGYTVFISRKINVGKEVAV